MSFKCQPLTLLLLRKRSMSPEDLEYYEVHDEMKLNLISQYTVVDRIITHSTTKDDDGNTSIDYLVKWKCLPYADATYENDKYLKEHYPEKIKDYEKMKNADTKPNTQYKVIKLIIFTFWHPRSSYYLRRLYHKDVGLQRWKPSLPGSPKFTNSGITSSMDSTGWLILGASMSFGVLSVSSRLPVFHVMARWKFYLRNFRRNSVILADEMGLGKTIQTVCFLNYIFFTAKVSFIVHCTVTPWIIMQTLTPLFHLSSG